MLDSAGARRGPRSAPRETLIARPETVVRFGHDQ